MIIDKSLLENGTIQLCLTLQQHESAKNIFLGAPDNRRERGGRIVKVQGQHFMVSFSFCEEIFGFLKQTFRGGGGSFSAVTCECDIITTVFSHLPAHSVVSVFPSR